MNTVCIEDLTLDQAKDWLSRNDPKDTANGFDWSSADIERDDAIDTIKENIATFGLSSLYLQVNVGTKEQAIREKIKELESDPRLYYPPADIAINCMLALVQTELNSRLDALYWALGEKAPNYHQLKSEEAKQ